MNDSNWEVVAGAKWVSAAAVAYWIGMSAALQTLLGLMALDFLTGVLVGITQKELNSRAASKGIARKAGALIIIVSVHLVSDTAGNHFGMPVDLGNIVAWFYVLSELISVVENCGKLGAPVPSYLLEAIKKAKRLQDTQDQQAAAVAEVQSNQKAAVVSIEKAQQATDSLIKTLPVKQDNEGVI